MNLEERVQIVRNLCNCEVGCQFFQKFNFEKDDALKKGLCCGCEKYLECKKIKGLTTYGLCNTFVCPTIRKIKSEILAIALSGLKGKNL